jgi:hypothetical protein
MLATLKTYVSERGDFSFLISYSEKAGGGATLTVSGSGEGLTVDITGDDVKALSQAVNEAEYTLARNPYQAEAAN